MKIREIRCAGLRGATPEGGWSNELRPDDCVHTLIAVHTDDGAVGLGSVFTNDSLVRASLAMLGPHATHGDALATAAAALALDVAAESVQLVHLDGTKPSCAGSATASASAPTSS